ncbi:hypothetical protein OU5_5444 [Pseudomonas mandelii JR-1]|uniref:Uncharacterized protein n=1 Tax=Pseudomonas mandelii JR-1 TaxID=1147786 RepID=A0A024EJK6_9PSED|nr:hypothetical protein OU5_5444 [Pseudomonas mandelii JR-1]
MQCVELTNLRLGKLLFYDVQRKYIYLIGFYELFEVFVCF